METGFDRGFLFLSGVTPQDNTPKNHAALDIIILLRCKILQYIAAHRWDVPNENSKMTGLDSVKNGAGR